MWRRPVHSAWNTSFECRASLVSEMGEFRELVWPHHRLMAPVVARREGGDEPVDSLMQFGSVEPGADRGSAPLAPAPPRRTLGPTNLRRALAFPWCQDAPENYQQQATSTAKRRHGGVWRYLSAFVEGCARHMGGATPRRSRTTYAPGSAATTTRRAARTTTRWPPRCRPFSRRRSAPTWE